MCLFLSFFYVKERINFVPRTYHYQMYVMNVYQSTSSNQAVLLTTLSNQAFLLTLVILESHLQVKVSTVRNAIVLKKPFVLYDRVCVRLLCADRPIFHYIYCKNTVSYFLVFWS